jgi:hypothetical protein
VKKDVAKHRHLTYHEAAEQLVAQEETGLPAPHELLKPRWLERSADTLCEYCHALLSHCSRRSAAWQLASSRPASYGVVARMARRSVILARLPAIINIMTLTAAYVAEAARQRPVLHQAPAETAARGAQLALAQACVHRWQSRTSNTLAVRGGDKCASHGWTGDGSDRPGRTCAVRKHRSPTHTLLALCVPSGLLNACATYACRQPLVA